ncbi:MAG: ribosome small subunit-dependent GTPase A, partial [Calditrichia bacterium]|nr:ribosome small subunit-dependent GTPase A [Calditrichia bacterium]
EITGKLLFNADSGTNLPAVGDWVLVQYFDDNTFAIIHEILPRKSILKRKVSGKNIDFQVLAANIDTAFIVQSLDSNYNLRRLERYLVMINESKIKPVVLLSKSDLISESELQNNIEEIKKINQTIEIIPFSNISEAGLKSISNILNKGKTYCLLGSSGVGKTSLLNKLIGEEKYDVKSIREKDDRGRHTTTRRQLIFMENRSMIIDTPGLRELGIFNMDEGLNETFNEITHIAEQCQFKDCTHTHEKGCAVKQAVENETIDKNRYNNYLKIQKESAFYKMSYLEKRQRDKEFGKMIKLVLKDKKKKK